MNYDYLKVLFKKYGHEKVIFVGFDIGKSFHVARIWNGYREELLLPFSFDANEKGYLELKAKLNIVINMVNPEEVFIGCEPSGHYYLNLMYKLTEDYPNAHFKLINPRATKSQRDMSMTRSKTDDIDAGAVLELMVQGNTYAFQRNEQSIEEIKELVRRIDRYTKDITSMKNRIHGYLDELYPMFEKIGAPLVDSISGRQFLSILPEPNKLKTITTDELIEMFKLNGFKLPYSYAKKFTARAQIMLLNITTPVTAKMESLKELIDQFLKLNELLEKAEASLSKRLKPFNFTDNILAIKGIGVITLGRIIAYLGNPMKFTAKAAAQFAGLTPYKSDSGNFIGRDKMSRMGHTKLRSVLVQLAHQLISSTGYFTAFYNHLVIDKRKNINLAVVATAHKILRTLVSMMHSGRPFRPPTAENIEVALSKTKRFTRKELERYQKMGKAQSLTQYTYKEYLTRV